MDGLTSRAVALVGRVRACAHHFLISIRVVRQLGRSSAAVALILAIALPAAHAQTTAVLQGVVTDRTTSQPLANASVYSTSNGVPLATTDANGNYSLTAAQLNNATSGTLYFQLATYFAVAQPFDLTQSPTVNATLLTGGAYVLGTITDAVTNSGVPQTSISFYFTCGSEPCSISQQNATSGSSYDSFSTVSAADGTYQFDSSLVIESHLSYLTNGFTYLQISATGYYSTAGASGLNLGTTAASIVNFTLVPIAGTAITGTVTDRATGQPIAGAGVYLYGYSNSSVPPVTTTDANGYYTVPGNLTNGVSGGQLLFEAPGHFATQQAYLMTTQGATVNASLLPGGVIEGTVTDSTTHQPIAGIALQFQVVCNGYAGCLVNNPNGVGTLTAITDANGQYLIDSSQVLDYTLSPAGTPFYQATSIDSVYLTGAGYFTGNVGEAILIAPATTTLNFSLLPTTNFALQGTVTDRATGLPIANAGVYLNFLYPNASAVTRTDGNGNYSLTASQLNNSTQGRLYYQAPGYFIAPAAPFDLTGSSTLNVTQNATLLPGGTFYQGRVSDAGTGLSVDQAHVFIIGVCSSYQCSAVGDPGQQSFTLFEYSGAGGLYSFDSSQIFEAALPTLTVVILQSTAIAYNPLSQPPPTTLLIGQPNVQDFALTTNGFTSAVTLDTSPTGLALTVDGVAVTAPQSYTWIPGNEHLIVAPSPQSVTQGPPATAVFAYWDQGGPASQMFVVPNGPETNIATFDTAAPTVSPSLSGTLGLNGWYVSDVALSWNISDPVANVTSTTGCDPLSVATDTTGQVVTCTAVGLAGAASSAVTIKRDTLAPVASTTTTPLPNGNGWNKTPVTVHFTGTDATSGIGTCTADQTVGAEGANQSSSPGTCADKAGNVSATVTASGINIDLTPPVVSASVSPTPNGSGWYAVPVTVAFSATDALSGVAPNGCSAPVTLSADGAGQSASGTCTDVAGNPGTGKSSSINIDHTPPAATAAANPLPNANGWNNSAVLVTFTGTDSLSGSGVRSCSAAANFGSQGAAQLASGTCVDFAGNVSALATLLVNIDETLPTVTVTTPSASASFAQNSVVPAAYSCTDALSGVLTCAGSVANGAPLNTSTVGSHNFVATATDKAGNSATSAVTYLVVAASPTPVITPTVTGTLGANGWYTSNVTVQWTVSSATKILSESGCSSHTLTGNTKGTTYTCTASNAAGTSSQSVTVKRDASPPTVHGSASPSANSAGWRNKTVTVTFTGTDSISGITSCTAPVVLSTEGVNQSATGDCTNGAGRSGTPVTVSGISIDLTPPAVTVNVPTNGAVYVRGSTVLASYACTDALSGIKSCSAPTANGSALPTGTRGAKTLTVTGNDVAGNAAKATVSYTVN